MSNDGLQGERLEMRYIPLDQAVLWDANPKQHDIGEIVESIRRYGFQDPPKVDASLGESGALVYGNGRTHALLMMQRGGEKPPRGILTDDAGQWYVPVKFGLDLASAQMAQAFAIDHNNLTLGDAFEVWDAAKIWDEDAYTAMLQDLAVDDVFAVTVDGDDLDALLREFREEDEPPEDPGAQVDKAAELQEKWQVQTGDVWEIPSKATPGKCHRLMCGDSTKAGDVDRLMGGERADAVITDPPYGIGIDDWDSPLDIDVFLSVVFGTIAKDAFFAFTIQMPPMVDWLIALTKTKLIYKDHIVWLKRKTTTAAQTLNHAHESLFVYRLGNPEYSEALGYYADVKIPLLDVGGLTYDAIDRYIKDLQHALKIGKKSLIDAGNNHHSSHAHLTGGRSDRSPELCGFTNVWSFLPENMSKLDGDLFHATMKPVKLLDRLVALLAHVTGLIYDPFLGSGTTAVAAERTDRICYGMEIEPKYCAVALERLAGLGLEPVRVDSA